MKTVRVDHVDLILHDCKLNERKHALLLVRLRSADALLPEPTWFFSKDRCAFRYLIVHSGLIQQEYILIQKAYCLIQRHHVGFIRHKLYLEKQDEQKKQAFI